MNTFANYANEKKKQELALLLQLRHKGQSKAATGNTLIAELYGLDAAQDKSYNNRYHRSLRLMIEEINQEGGVICSDSVNGYWWAADLKDGMPAAEKNEARALTQLENAKRLKENIVNQYGGQIGMGI